MRNGQQHHNHNHKRMRGRHHHQNNNNRKNQNPLTRVYESNGPDVKIRGTASHVAEKYIQLARDAQGSGDPVAAENYYQHAEHYFRLIAAANEQFRQQNPQHFNQQQPNAQQGGEQPQQGAADNFDDGDDEFGSPQGQNEPYTPRDQQAQPYQGGQPYNNQGGQQHNNNYNNNQQHRPQHYSQPQQNAQPQHGGSQQSNGGQDLSGLPSFITGGGPQPSQGNQGQPYQGNGQNGYDNQDRFPRHRRRRHRGNRPDFGNNPNQQSAQPNEAGDNAPPPAIEPGE